MLLEISQDRRDKFSNAVGSTQKAGRLFETLLNYLRLCSSVLVYRIF